jgi:hypothetical protein
MKYIFLIFAVDFMFVCDPFLLHVFFVYTLIFCLALHAKPTPVKA